MPENNKLTIAIEILKDVVGKFDKLEKNDDIVSFIKNELKDSGLIQSNEEINETAIEISNTIDDVEKELKSIQDAQKSGTSRNQWLKSNIDKLIEKLPDSEQNYIVSSIKKALHDANSELFHELMGEKVPEGKIEEYKASELVAEKMMHESILDLQKNTLLNILVLDGSLNDLDAEKEIAELKSVKDYLDADLNDPSTKNFVKIAATAMVIAKSRGFVLLNNFSTFEITLLAYRGATYAKLAYKLANGNLDVPELIDEIIDRAAAILSLIVVKATKRVGERVGQFVGAAIGNMFGPAGTVIGASIGSAIGSMAGSAVGLKIRSGVSKIANYCKEKAKTIWRKIKDDANIIFSGIKNFLLSRS